MEAQHDLDPIQAYHNNLPQQQCISFHDSYSPDTESPDLIPFAPLAARITDTIPLKELKDLNEKPIAVSGALLAIVMIRTPQLRLKRLRVLPSEIRP